LNIITFRRYYLDNLLSATDFFGKVLDVGGKKDNKRGNFRPSLGKVEKWEYLNIDPATNPDYCCSAEAIPVADETYDIALMTEVLEHLENPERVIAEVYRVLKKEGHVVATMPFLYPIHADPLDFQRWTPAKIKLEFENAGLIIEKIEPVGSVFGVLYDLLNVSLGIASKNQYTFKNRVINKLIMPILAKILIIIDKLYLYKSSFITTGYYITAKKIQIVKKR